MAPEHLVTTDAGHGRLETRQYWTTPDADLLADLTPGGDAWPDLGCVAMVVRERAASDPTSRETSYYLSSLDGAVGAVAAAVRGHWGIEKRQPWVAENLAVLRRIARNLIRLDRSRPGRVHPTRL